MFTKKRYVLSAIIIIGTILFALVIHGACRNTSEIRLSKNVPYLEELAELWVPYSYMGIKTGGCQLNADERKDIIKLLESVDLSHMKPINIDSFISGSQVMSGMASVNTTLGENKYVILFEQSGNSQEKKIILSVWKNGELEMAWEDLANNNILHQLLELTSSITESREDHENVFQVRSMLVNTEKQYLKKGESAVVKTLIDEALEESPLNLQANQKKENAFTVELKRPKETYLVNLEDGTFAQVQLNQTIYGKLDDISLYQINRLLMFYSL